MLDIHDLHLWTLTSGMHVATAHLVVDGTQPGQVVLDTARTIFSVEHGIEHATLQVEATHDQRCQELGW